MGVDPDRLQGVLARVQASVRQTMRSPLSKIGEKERGYVRSSAQNSRGIPRQERLLYVTLSRHRARQVEADGHQHERPSHARRGLPG